MMGKIAWILVTDLHLFDKNISSRIDYSNEMDEIAATLINLGNKYKNLGYQKVNLILMGDVFHRGYRSPDRAINDSFIFVHWNMRFGEIFSVLGNHEISYHSNNPFYNLVTNIESEKVKTINDRVITPKGLLPLIRVVDRLDDGELHFYFNHNRCPVTEPITDGINVGLFHSEIVCHQIKQQMQNELGEEIFGKTVNFENTTLFDNYSYCFFGHMHKIYGTWELSNGCKLDYLGSLGRTNSSEVNNKCLERKIPIILTQDGNFQGIEEFRFNLRKREDCLDELHVQQLKNNYEIRKQQKYAREYEVNGDNPVENLKTYFRDDALSLVILDGLLSSEKDSYGAELEKRINGGF